MVNKVILIGNLGKDPEVRKTKNGTAVCNFPLATSDKYKDKNGEKQEKVEWHNLVAWDKKAELCEKYLTKGSQIYAEGKLSTKSYEDKEGNKRYKTEVVLTNVTFLKTKTDQAPTKQDSPNTDKEVDDELPF